MSVPVCPEDFIVIQLDKKFKDTSEGGLFIDTAFRPGYHATVTGTVLSTPRGLSNHPQKIVIPMEVQPGDELAFAYRVVYNQEASDNASELFYEDPAFDPYITSWTAQNGKQLIRRNRKHGKFDAALFREENGKAIILDNTEGDAKHVNEFIRKYKPDRETNFQYRNAFVLDGEEYWKVDYQMAYIAKRNEEMIMIGGYALLEAPRGGVERDKEYSGMLEIYGDVREKVKTELQAKLIAIGTPLKGQPTLSVKPGDTVVVNRNTTQEYNFWGKDYLLVRQDQLLAVA